MRHPALELLQALHLFLRNLDVMCDTFCPLAGFTTFPDFSFFCFKHITHYCNLPCLGCLYCSLFCMLFHYCNLLCLGCLLARLFSCSFPTVVSSACCFTAVTCSVWAAHKYTCTHMCVTRPLMTFLRVASLHWLKCLFPRRRPALYQSTTDDYLITPISC